MPRRQCGAVVLAGGAALLRADSALASAQPSEPIGSHREGETLDEALSEIPEDMRGDFAGNIPADRRLSAKQLDVLLRLSDCLIDKTRSHRIRAARDLGLLGHKYGMPALLAVMRDEQEDPHVRQACVLPLSLILDKRAVYFLIEDALGSDCPLVAMDAHRWLAQMVHDGVELDLQFDLPDGLQPPQYDAAKQSRAEYDGQRREWVIKRARFLQQEWRTWWKAHKDKPVQLSRTVRWID